MNMFCKVDEEGFPHWNGVDFMRFWFLPNNRRFLTGKIICGHIKPPGWYITKAG